MASVHPEAPHGGFVCRIVWFVLLWLAGVGTVGTVAYILRLWIA